MATASSKEELKDELARKPDVDLLSSRPLTEEEEEEESRDEVALALTSKVQTEVAAGLRLLAAAILSFPTGDEAVDSSLAIEKRTLSPSEQSSRLSRVVGDGWNDAELAQYFVHIANAAIRLMRSKEPPLEHITRCIVTAAALYSIKFQCIYLLYSDVAAQLARSTALMLETLESRLMGATPAGREAGSSSSSNGVVEEVSGFVQPAEAKKKEQQVTASLPEVEGAVKACRLYLFAVSDDLQAARQAAAAAAAASPSAGKLTALQSPAGGAAGPGSPASALAAEAAAAADMASLLDEDIQASLQSNQGRALQIVAPHLQQSYRAAWGMHTLFLPAAAVLALLTALQAAPTAVLGSALSSYLKRSSMAALYFLTEASITMRTAGAIVAGIACLGCLASFFVLSIGRRHKGGALTPARAASAHAALCYDGDVRTAFLSPDGFLEDVFPGISSTVGAVSAMARSLKRAADKERQERKLQEVLQRVEAKAKEQQGERRRVKDRSASAAAARTAGAVDEEQEESDLAVLTSAAQAEERKQQKKQRRRLQKAGAAGLVSESEGEAGSAAGGGAGAGGQTAELQSVAAWKPAARAGVTSGAASGGGVAESKGQEAEEADSSSDDDEEEEEEQKASSSSSITSPPLGGHTRQAARAVQDIRRSLSSTGAALEEDGEEEEEDEEGEEGEQHALQPGEVFRPLSAKASTASRRAGAGGASAEGVAAASVGAGHLATALGLSSQEAQRMVDSLMAQALSESEESAAEEQGSSRGAAGVGLTGQSSSTSKGKGKSVGFQVPPAILSSIISLRERLVQDGQTELAEEMSERIAFLQGVLAEQQKMAAAAAGRG